MTARRLTQYNAQVVSKLREERKLSTLLGKPVKRPPGAGQNAADQASGWSGGAHRQAHAPARAPVCDRLFETRTGPLRPLHKDPRRPVATAPGARGKALPPAQGDRVGLVGLALVDAALRADLTGLTLDSNRDLRHGYAPKWCWAVFIPRPSKVD